VIVDIHNHILPGIDDGPKNWDEMLLLAKQAVNIGITNIIATPHHKHVHGHHFYENNPQQIRLLVNQANEKLRKDNVPLTIHPGIEFHLHEGIQQDLQNHFDTFLTLNDGQKYMLLEPPAKHYPKFTEEVCLKLLEKGFTPILAHPERNRIIRHQPELVYKLVKKGVLIQITADSLVGTGRRLKNFSLHLLDHQLVHFIASDAHHPIKRGFKLKEAYKYIEKQYSFRYRSYFEQNAVKVIEGKPISIWEPKWIEQKWQYFFLYSHPLNSKRIIN
jgi:protein-tyrosine phosphatase